MKAKQFFLPLLNAPLSATNKSYLRKNQEELGQSKIHKMLYIYRLQ